jgi:hypothetical protein
VLQQAFSVIFLRFPRFSGIFRRRCNRSRIISALFQVVPALFPGNKKSAPPERAFPKRVRIYPETRNSVIVQRWPQ